MSLNPFSRSSKPQYTPEELKILAQAEEIKARKHREEAEYATRHQQSVNLPLSNHLRVSLNTWSEEPKLPNLLTKLSPSGSMSEYFKSNPPENVSDHLEKEKQGEQQMLKEMHLGLNQQK